MSKLEQLKKIEAELQNTKNEIVQAQAIEEEKNAEAKLQREIDRRAAEAKAFIARQELLNLEKTIIPLVKQYAQLKRNHVSNEFTQKFDDFLADLRGEKKPRKPRKLKIEE